MQIKNCFAILVAAALLAMAWAAFKPTGVQAQQAPPVFEPAPCMFEIPFMAFFPPEQFGFECGYVTVPEQHARPNGPTIRLPVAISRATGKNPQPDPLFLAQGGPGGDAFGIFAFVPQSFGQQRDIVIFNQRGTLHAEPSLLCPEIFEAQDTTLALPPEEAAKMEMDLYAQCYRRLQADGVNLSAFNSLENAADVDAIRQALGYENINFYGVSYGTLLGLHLMRHYPNQLRSVILDGVVPPQLNFIPLIPQVTERIFSEMFRVCANNKSCRANYPNLEQRFTALVEQLDRQPVTIPIENPETGQTVEMYVDGKTAMDMFFQIFYAPEMYAAFPKVVADMESGDYSFWQGLWPQLAFDRTISEGMYFSVICAEDADFDPATIPVEGVRPRIVNALQNDLEDMLKLCQLWQVDILPSSVDNPVQSEIPTLLLSGQFDPITPPSNAAAAAQFLTNSFDIVDPVASHGAAFGDACINGVVQDFLDNPTVKPDTTCLQEKSPAGFVLPTVLTVPLSAKLLALDIEALVQTGIAGFFLVGILSAIVVWPVGFIIGQIRNKQGDASPGQKRVGRAGKGLVILFGGLAVFFVLGITFFMAQSISSTPMLLLSAVSGWAMPLFIIPFLLILLCGAMIVILVLVWQKGVWSIWGRMYYTGLTLCAVGYVVMLFSTGMMSVLL